MRSTLLALSPAVFLLLGCAQRPSPKGGGGGTTTGSRTSASGGSGGATGSGGSRGGAGGSASSTGGATQTGGSGGSDSGGSGGNGGTGAASDTGGTNAPGDAATDGHPGADVAAGGTGGGTTGRGGSGGTTTATGGVSGGGGGSGSSGGTATGGTGSGGRSGSGGATGTGGTTSVSTAPTPCSFPSSWNPGSATYTTYSLPNPATACGYEGSNNTIKNIANGGNFAAIPGNTSQDFNTRDRCGACVQIGSAIITIVDECPNDTNPPCKNNPNGHLDLSNAGAGAGGVKGDPNVRGQNQWKFVPCPVNGNVVVRLKNGNNNEIYIENVIVPISAVTCNDQTGSRTFYGSWHFGQDIPGATCEVTDLANRKITIKAGSAQGQNVDTGVQFPKCQ